LGSELGSEPGQRIVARLAGPAASRPVLAGIDGRSGSGKSWLAGQVCQGLARQGVSYDIVVMDDLYAGWSGLAAAVPALCRQVIDPLRQGASAAYQRYDWELGQFADVVRVEPVDVVLIEGVGATWHDRRDAFACTVWVQAPAPERYERACARSGQGDFAAHAEAWARAEDALFGPDAYPCPPGDFDLVVRTDGAEAGLT
jgi:uridine kinase